MKEVTKAHTCLCSWYIILLNSWFPFFGEITNKVTLKNIFLVLKSSKQIFKVIFSLTHILNNEMKKDVNSKSLIKNFEKFDCERVGWSCRFYSDSID